MISSAGLFPMPVPLPFSQRGSPITPPVVLAPAKGELLLILKSQLSASGKSIVVSPERIPSPKVRSLTVLLPMLSQR